MIQPNKKAGVCGQEYFRSHKTHGHGLDMSPFGAHSNRFMSSANMEGTEVSVLLHSHQARAKLPEHGRTPPKNTSFLS